MFSRFMLILLVALCSVLGGCLCSGHGVDDCPLGKNGQGVAPCIRAQEGNACISKNPERLLVCHECAWLDQDTARNQGDAFKNPRCR